MSDEVILRWILEYAASKKFSFLISGKFVRKRGEKSHWLCCGARTKKKKKNKKKKNKKKKKITALCFFL
jgi:hypothetical protein